LITSSQIADRDDQLVGNLATKPQSAVHIATADRRSRTGTPKNDLITLSKDIHKPLSEGQQGSVEKILSVCGAEHSRRFYESVTRTVPTSQIWSTLGEVTDATATGRLRKSKGALFTAIVKGQIENHSSGPRCEVASSSTQSSSSQDMPRRPGTFRVDPAR